MKPQDVLKIYDNGGKTADRYAIIFKDWRYWNGDRLFQCLGLSENPTHPQYGVSLWGEAILGRHLGKVIQWENLPENVRDHAEKRLLEE